MAAAAQPLTPLLDAVDHLLLGVPDLDRGVEWVEQRTGVSAAPGGVHPGMGTRNALLSLGSGQYLEIIAPDPEQQTYNFQIDVRGLAEPRLITFAAVTKDIDAVAAAAVKAGFQTLGPRAGSRRTGAGAVLRWKTLGVMNRFGSGGIEPVPFFIEWDRGVVHPSASSPGGCRIESIGLEHPNPAELRAALAALGLDAKVAESGGARIVARIRTPKGRVELS